MSVWSILHENSNRCVMCRGRREPREKINAIQYGDEIRNREISFHKDPPILSMDNFTKVTSHHSLQEVFIFQNNKIYWWHISLG